MNGLGSVFHGGSGFHGEVTAKLLQGDEWQRMARGHAARQQALRQAAPAKSEPARLGVVSQIGEVLVRLGTRMQGKRMSQMSSIVP